MSDDPNARPDVPVLALGAVLADDLARIRALVTAVADARKRD